MRCEGLPSHTKTMDFTRALPSRTRRFSVEKRAKDFVAINACNAGVDRADMLSSITLLEAIPDHLRQRWASKGH